MGRKSSSTAVSKVSSASAPAASSVTASTQKASVLKSAFAPSQLQLHLFASVVQSFDSHQLRIHDTTTGRLRCQHESRPGSRITCLDWGYYGGPSQERHTSSKKKRKRDQDSNEGAVVAYGTTSSEIYLFSPAEGKIIGTLEGTHERGVRDFKFSPSEYKEGWSIGEDGKLVQWDLATCQTTRVISLPDPAVSALATPSIQSPHVLCASSTPFMVTLDSLKDFHVDRYDSFKNSIHSLVRSEGGSTASTEYFLAADTERYINIYNIPQKRLARTLVAGSGVIAVEVSYGPKDIPTRSSQQMLSAVTIDGTVELFVEPFELAKQLNGDLKSSRKNLAKKASAQVRLVSSNNKGKHVSIIAASLQGPDLIVVSSEGGVDLSFQKIRWQDEGNGELLFDGVKEVIKVTSASTLNTATLNGVKEMGKSLVDESRTVVVNGEASGPRSDAIEISSSDDGGEDSTDEIDGKDESSEETESGSDLQSDKEMAEAYQVDDIEAQVEDMHDGAVSEHESTAEEPTFGEILASKHPNTISIADNLAPTDTRISVSGRDGVPTIPSGMSLGTVLTQSLRTNDQNLLEACLHTQDINIVKNTIQRLDSSLAGILLAKLAERLTSRPGRYGHLITWVQWTCIAHGGAIAAQPDVAAKVRTLYQVLTQRSRTLDSLLLLKGKLDMLDAQLSFRKQLSAQRPSRRDDQDEPGMIYIEGEDNWDSTDEEDLDEDVSRPVKKLAKGRGQAKTTKRALEDLIGDDESSENEELLPLENGDLESDEEASEDNDDDDGRFAINGQRHALVVDQADVSGAEESDPDDEGDDDDISAESSSDEGSSNDDEAEEEEDEEDSEMDSFINDDSISFAEDEDDIHIPGDEDVEEAAPSPEPIVKQSKQKRSSATTTKTKKDSKNKASKHS